MLKNSNSIARVLMIFPVCLAAPAFAQEVEWILLDALAAIAQRERSEDADFDRRAHGGRP